MVIYCLLHLSVGYFSRISLVSQTTEKGSKTDSQSVSDKTRSSVIFELATKWSWDWCSQWEGIPLSLPISFTVSEDDLAGVAVGKGMGVMAAKVAIESDGQAAADTLKTSWQVRKSRQGFERPLPALYESQLPLSMAKIIMSRHTARRPNPNRPLRATPTTTSKRCQSMV